MFPRHIKLTYLSRSMSKMYNSDGPIGNPFGGPGRTPLGMSRPSYMQYNEPVTAVVAAFEVMTAFEAVAAIGTALSVVGMVTGNSDLAKIGGVMGLVGGFGAMAQGGVFGADIQSWAGGVAKTGADTGASVMGVGAEQTAAPVTDAIVKNVSDAGITGGDIVSQVAGDGSMSGANMLTDANLQQATGLMDTTQSALPAPGLMSEPASSALQAEFANPTAPNAMADAAMNGGNLSAVKAAAQTGIDTGASLFDKVLNFANKNQAVTQAALTGISKAYQSPQDRALKEAQISSANAASGLYDARAAEISANMANANAIPTVRGMQVNPNAQIYNQKPVVSAPVMSTGLIQTRSMT